METTNKISNNNLNLLSILLFTPILIEVMTVIIQQMGFGNTSLFTVGVQLFIYVYLFSHARIYVVDFYILAAFYLVFALNYLIFPDSRPYLTSVNMILIYIQTLPCCVFSIRKITNWENFWTVFRPYVIWGSILSTVMVVFLNYSKYLVYMEFSYALLPIVCANYYYARNKTYSSFFFGNLLHFLLFVSTMAELIIFGARAAVFFAIIFVAAFELLRSDSKLIYKVIVAGLFGILIFLFMRYEPEIMNKISTLSLFQNSRILTKYQTGKLFYSQGREQLELICNQRLSRMGLDISGFFGDRVYVAPSPYPHNIIRELLMSWGWIIGIFLIVLLALLIVFAVVFAKEYRDITLFLIMSLFTRYFVSGSYIQEMNFYVFLFSVYTICKTGNYVRRVRFIIFERQRK